MNEMLSKEVELTVKEVLEGLLKRSDEAISSKTPVELNTDLLAKIRNVDHEVLKAIVGETFADKLKSLSDVIDFTHPALPDSLINGFAANNVFATTLEELLIVAENNKGQKLPTLSRVIQDTLLKSKDYRESCNAIVKPPTRCIGDAKQREIARSGKKMKPIDLKEWQKSNSKNWHNYPATFRLLVRESDYLEREVSQSKGRSVKFETIGAISLSASVSKSVDQLTKFASESYIGFFKLKMVDAAIILAKLHGAGFNSGNPEQGVLTVQRKNFDSIKFWLEANSKILVRKDHRKSAIEKKAKEAKEEAERKPDEKKKEKRLYVGVKSFIVPDYFGYAPRSYPIHEFSATKPRHIEEALVACEHHPDLDGKVAYDHYWVVVPGFDLIQESFYYSSTWILRDGDECELFDTQEELQMALDVKLTEAGAIHPVLLGEKDGKCHFISIW